MEVMLDDAILAKLQAAQVDINVHVTASINITPFVARQKVNVLVLDKVGTGFLAEAPALVATEGHLYWRVPVALALAGRGRLGLVGTVDVDVQTGELLADEPLFRNISQHANQLVAGSTL